MRSFLRYIPTWRADPGPKKDLPGEGISREGWMISGDGGSGSVSSEDFI